MWHIHELNDKAKLAEDGGTDDVVVALVDFVFHLGKDVTDDAAIVVLGHEKKLRSREE